MRCLWCLLAMAVFFNCAFVTSAYAEELRGRIVFQNKKMELVDGDIHYEYTLRVKEDTGKLHTIYLRAEKNSSMHDAIKDALEISRNVQITYYKKGIKKIGVSILSIGSSSKVQYKHDTSNNVRYFSRTQQKNSQVYGNSGVNIPME